MAHAIAASLARLLVSLHSTTTATRPKEEDEGEGGEITAPAQTAGIVEGEVVDGEYFEYG